MRTVDIIVRKAKPSDADALAVLFRESWEQAYRGIIPHLHLQRMIQQRSAAWWTKTITRGDRTLVLELAGQLGGYVTFGRSRWPLPYEGEIYELYMAPTHQGVGLGEHLFEGARHALDNSRMSGLLVWALAENTGACEFYRRRGGRPVARTKEKMADRALLKLGFAWK